MRRKIFYDLTPGSVFCVRGSTMPSGRLRWFQKLEGALATGGETAEHAPNARDVDDGSMHTIALGTEVIVVRSADPHGCTTTCPLEQCGAPLTLTHTERSAHSLSPAGGVLLPVLLAIVFIVLVATLVAPFL